MKLLLGRFLNLFWIPVLCLMLTLGCSYHRLDTCPHTSPWLKKGETVRVDNFKNTTHRLGIEEPFKKALENRIIANSPWELRPSSSNARWIIQATIERYKVRPLTLISCRNFDNRGSAAAGSAGRLDVAITVSVQLLDGITGEAVVVRPGMTFSHQYRVDLNFTGFYNQELHILDTMVDDFAESFLTQLLEGND